MSVLVTDPEMATRLRAERESTDGSQHDEVWDGVYVMSPLPNLQHQILATRLCKTLDIALEQSDEWTVINGINVSDREEDWVHNYREPDAVVISSGNPGKDCDTHFCGGPDFLAEILSPNDLAREKLPFYAKLGVRELLIIDRYPWALELYRLDAGQLKLVGRSTLEDNQVLTSTVLQLSFRLVPGQKRPEIEVSRIDGDQKWLV